jgi:amidase
MTTDLHTDPVAAVQAALDRIDKVDARVQAWVEVDRAGALAAAKQLAASGKALPLLGVTVGIKDIIDAGGLPTRLGTRVKGMHSTPELDSTAVAKLKAAGAVILGKTHTTAFANRDVSPARNPWNLEHTPGGSSSGSAAAVAAGMATLALGSQTIGSTLRPAAYCGLVGLKATHGRISAAGVFPLASSFDHVGIICRTVADAARALGVLAGFDEADLYSLDAPVEDYAAAAAAGALIRPRLAYARSDAIATAEPVMVEHLDAVVAELRAAGAFIEEVEMPASSQQVVDIGTPLQRAEAAVAHAPTFDAHRDEYEPNISSLIEAGRKVTGAEYAAARFELLRLRRAFTQLLSHYDAMLMAVSTGPAPEGLAQTGNAVFCAPGSFMGLPAIALPSGLTENGLPLGLQLLAPQLMESRLLATAAWVESILDFKSKPSLD